MTNYYVDFEILGAPCDGAFLRNKVFNLIHGTLNQNFAGKIGLSFPDYKENTLGKRIRAFGTFEDLNVLTHQSKLIGLAESGAVRINAILPVPKLVSAARFIRDRRMEKQAKAFLARSKRRREKRGTQEKSIAQPHQQNENDKTTILPYLKLQSTSNRFTFSLYIRKEPAIDIQHGTYSGYGLSHDGSTVPWF